MDRLNYERTIYGLAMRPINGLVHSCAFNHKLAALHLGDCCFAGSSGHPFNHKLPAPRENVHAQTFAADAGGE